MGSTWTVSVNGVLLDGGGAVVLLANERDEWELPGGQLDSTDESLPAALQREFAEELGIDVVVGSLLDTWIYEPLPGRRVVIVTYACAGEVPAELSHSEEHIAVGRFVLAELDGLSLPAGYRRSIRVASATASGPGQRHDGN